MWSDNQIKQIESVTGDAIQTTKKIWDEEFIRHGSYCSSIRYCFQGEKWAAELGFLR